MKERKLSGFVLRDMIWPLFRLDVANPSWLAYPKQSNSCRIARGDASFLSWD